MKGFLNFLSAADLWVSRITRTICIVSMAVVFIMFLLNIFVRFVPVYNFTQTDEWTQLFLVWVIFFGAQELVRTKSHFVVDVLTRKFTLVFPTKKHESLWLINLWGNFRLKLM